MSEIKTGKSKTIPILWIPFECILVRSLPKNAKAVANTVNSSTFCAVDPVDLVCFITDAWLLLRSYPSKHPFI